MLVTRRPVLNGRDSTRMAPLALQLYTLREQLADHFEAVIRQVAAIGYRGVETAGLYGPSPPRAAELFRELGLEVTSMHAPLPLLDHLDETIDLARVLSTRRVVCAWYPPERLATPVAIRGVCDELNRANQELRAQGLELLYHNHWAECARVDDKFAYQYMLEYLDPTIAFEIDVYWAKTAGLDPAAWVRELGARAPLLHIKDGPATLDAPMTAVGEGVVDMFAIAEASQAHAAWWIVELDRCATDMMQAVTQSYIYLVQRGLAYGR